jgi:hypothetical protein
MLRYPLFRVGDENDPMRAQRARRPRGSRVKLAANGHVAESDWRQRHVMNRLGLLIGVVPLMMFAAPAVAEHENDHRYDVKGYVLSVDKRPLDDVPVAVLKDGQLIGSGRTNGEGSYAIRVHLHDSDIGATLTVRADKHQASIRMQAEHGNQTTARVHHVNFVGGVVSEKELFGSTVPTWVYLVAAPFVLWAVVYFGEMIRRKIRKLQLAKAPAQPGQQKKGRKGKRKR